MGKLKEQNLVDDTAFAEFWKENRQSFRPRSRRMTRLELRRKGVDSGVIDRIVAEIDDGDSAYRAAQPKARQMKAADYDVFRRRLGEYLRRRGFDYEVIKRTVEKIWQERDS
jgi:regulatory protein